MPGAQARAYDENTARMNLNPSGARPAALAYDGMVTAPHVLATQSGLRILMEGGNAADSIIAVAASLAVVYPHMTGIGGDVFFLYYDAGRNEVVGYNGSGAAAAAATLEYYRGRGLQTIPERGGAAALTVPGTVDAWFALHERFGAMDMGRILAPAITLAGGGAPAARSFVGAVTRLRDLLAVDEAAASLYLEHGPRRVGDRFVNPALERSLQAIRARGELGSMKGRGRSPSRNAAAVRKARCAPRTWQRTTVSSRPRRKARSSDRRR